MSKDKILERFMKEMFDIKTLTKAGFFTKEMKGDYEAMAKRVCDHFGFKTVYEYGSKEIRCHLSYARDKSGFDSTRPIHVDESGNLKEEPFVTVIPSIYE